MNNQKDLKKKRNDYKVQTLEEEDDDTLDIFQIIKELDPNLYKKFCKKWSMFLLNEIKIP